MARGFEYEPLRRASRSSPGQRELELRLKRVDDLTRERWFCGDTHVHFLSTQGSQLEAPGEDLNVVNLLLSQWGSLFTNTEEFTGAPSVGRDGETIVYATQENRQHLLGHLSLLGLQRAGLPVVLGRPRRGRDRRHARDDALALGRRLPRAGRDGRHPALPDPERRAGGADRHRAASTPSR